MWYWEFNAGSYYVTCFEVEITGDAGGDDDDDDDDDDDNSGGSTSYDDYIIQIPVRYDGASYDENTLATSANSIVLDDDSITFNFVVIDESGITTTYVMCFCLVFFHFVFAR